MSASVLLAHGDVALAFDLAERLRITGTPVLVRTTAQEALEAAVAEQAPVVVLDLGLPGPRPESFIAVLHKVRPGVRVVGVAATTDPAHAGAVEEGLFYYTVAPTAEFLETVVRAALKRGAP